MALTNTIESVSLKISPLLSSAANTAKHTVTWLGRQVQYITKEALGYLSHAGNSLARVTKKIVSFTSPYFATFKDFLKANNKMIIGATAGIAIGAAIYVAASYDEKVNEVI